MNKLQDDFIYIYNSLQSFSKETLEGLTQNPIRVDFDNSFNSICFEQKGNKVYLPTLNYYAGHLKDIHNSWLLPNDYDYLMKTMSSLIKVDNGPLINEHILVSPEYYGCDIYLTKVTTATFKNGPELIGQLRFVSGNSWLFKKITNFKYGSR